MIDGELETVGTVEILPLAVFLKDLIQAFYLFVEEYSSIILLFN